MEISNERLLAIIERFTGLEMLVVGDLILDHYVWGKVDRISPEAPVVVVRVTEENKRPGGAGNVANNLATLGAKVSVCGLAGGDDAGRELLELLESHGIDTSGVLLDRARPTTVKTRVIAHAQQVVRVDREETSPVPAAYEEGIAAALQSKLDQVKGLLISDYAKGTICAAVCKQVAKGFEDNLLGFGKVPVVIDPKAPNFSLYTRANIIKPNRPEAEKASGCSISSRADAVAAGRVLLERWNCDSILITLGEDGMVMVSGPGADEEIVEVETVAREVYDVSGAGDTVTAVFGLALAAGASGREAALLANYAAGVVVSEVGTVAVNQEDLREALSKRE